MRKISIPVIFLGTILSLSACKEKPSFKKYEGLEYSIVKDVDGDKKPAAGDFLEFHLRMSIDDSLITDTRKDNAGKPVQTPYPPESLRGDFWSGIKLMTAGDSAVFLVSIDTLFAQVKQKQPDAQIPDFLKGKKIMKYEIVLVSVKSKEEMQKDMDAKNSEQTATDDKLLLDYFAKNNLTPTKTASGLYYVITTEGTGETVKAGQSVEVKYIGTTLDGKVFDANMGPDAKRTEALPVTVGQGQVIRGWDEGLQLLKNGSKAKFYIPSPLAYGAQSPSPDIAANAILIFEVEIVSVK
jgi:FKBP-type peptidyl-prolyl cis-trans isomerase FkpA